MTMSPDCAPVYAGVAVVGSRPGGGQTGRKPHTVLPVRFEVTAGVICGLVDFCSKEQPGEAVREPSFEFLG